MIRLPKTLSQGAGQVDRAHIIERLERADEGLLGDAFDLELDLGQRWLAVDAADRRQGPDATADLGHAGHDGRDGRRRVDEIESDRRGRRPAPTLPPGHQPSEPRPAAPGRRSLTDSESGSIPPVGSCSS